MTYSLNDIRPIIRTQIGDPNGISFADADIDATVKLVLRECWPAFYEDVLDETSYTGANALAVDTTEIAIPSAFLASGTRAAGQIFSIWCRMTDGTQTAPFNVVYFRMRKGVYIDPLTAASPKIHFVQPINRQCEIKIWGGRPLTPPSDATTAIAGTDTPGLLDYIVWRVEAYLRSMNTRAASADREANAQRRILAQQEADKLRSRYKMPRAYFTDLRNPFR